MGPRAIFFLVVAIPGVILLAASYREYKTIERREDPFDYYFKWATFVIGVLALLFLLSTVLFWPEFLGF